MAIKPGRAVAGKALGIGGAVAAVLIAAYVFRKSEAGSQVLASLKGAGNVGGKAILAPIEGLVSGFAEGTGALGQTTAALGANFEAFKIAFGKADFASIIDGSYIQKYGGILGGATQPKAATGSDTFSKDTVQDERPNDKSPSTSNFKPPVVTGRPVSTTPKPTIADRAKQAVIQVQTRFTNPRTGVITNKPVTTSASNTVRFRQNDGDIVFVTPTTAQALIQRGLGRIL